MKLIASWSGGKDCCLACYKAMIRGHDIVWLLNLVSRETGRCCFHGVDGRLLEVQAGSMGIPLCQKEMSADMAAYEDEFKSAVREIQGRTGAEGVVFGDVYLDEHKSWVDRVCSDLGLQAVEPLWNMAPSEAVGQFIRAGFDAVVVTCKADLMGKEYLGRRVDDAFLNHLVERRICPCGENGEFHTLVLDGPIFGKRIEITSAEPVLRKGFWDHWSLDIREWAEVRK